MNYYIYDMDEDQLHGPYTQSESNEHILSWRARERNSYLILHEIEEV